MSKSNTETVKVMVRVRPMNKSEKNRNCKHIIKVDKETGQINLTRPDAPENTSKDFTYDSVYDIDS